MTPNKRVVMMRLVHSVPGIMNRIGMGGLLGESKVQAWITVAQRRIVENGVVDTLKIAVHERFSRHVGA